MRWVFFLLFFEIDVSKPEENQQWTAILKDKDIRKHLVTNIDPERVMEHMPDDVLEREHEEWVKKTKEREGNIRACKRLLACIVLSKHKEWPRILITSLESAGYPTEAGLLKTTHEEIHSDRAGKTFH